ncbi:MAG: branched-chain amino acid ABC transporter permease [Acidimicrobiales bacterium]
MPDAGSSPRARRGHHAGRGRTARDIAAIVVLPLAFVIAGQVYPNQQVLVTMMVYLALAQGVNVIYGFTGYLPFGYVGFFGAGAYGMSLAVVDLHLPMVLALPIGGATAALVALVLSPLLRLSGAYFAIASLASAEALAQVVSNPSLASVTQGPYGINLVSVYNANASYLAAVGLVAVSMACVVYLRRSRFGLALRAIRSDATSASMAGVDVVRERAGAWLMSAVLAGLAGAVFAWYTSTFYPQAVFDVATTVFALVFALFGGVGTTWGPVVGTVVLYSVYNKIGVSAPQYFQLVYGLLIVALVLFLPAGLASLASRLGDDLGARLRRAIGATPRGSREARITR